MAFLTILFDLLKSFAWPITIVVISFFFKSELVGLIPRLKSLGVKGAEFVEPPSQVIENVRQTVETQTLIEFEGMPRTSFMAEVEKTILADVNLVKTDKRIPLLTRHLVQARLEAAFGRVYTFIFGSQIEGLEKLKLAGGRVPLADAQLFFEETKTRFPEFYSKSSFSEWFSYVSGSGLAIIDNASVQITPLGEEFLTFVQARGYPTRNW
jgi:hypothetical protein